MNDIVKIVQEEADVFESADSSLRVLLDGFELRTARSRLPSYARRLYGCCCWPKTSRRWVARIIAVHTGSDNAREWFEQKPEPIPGQLDLLADVESTLGTPTERVRKQRTSRGRSGRDGQEGAPSPSRPASTERPPSTGLSVAEVVARRVR